LCWRRPEHARFIARLERLGFRLREEKVYVQRGLEGWRSPWPDPFTYASLADAGEVVFIETLAGMVEPSTADPADAARREFADFLEMAGAAFDPARWLLALVDGQPAGLALPQPFPDGPAEGTLFWVGLLPEWRGRGWGRALHGRGLEELERAGVRRYVGSTAVDNAAMRRVFALNGCEEQGMRITYVQPGTA
jgi:ribosomal protein S18 acetylase RimI-like enzyme